MPKKLRSHPHYRPGAHRGRLGRTAALVFVLMPVLLLIGFASLFAVVLSGFSVLAPVVLGTALVVSSRRRAMRRRHYRRYNRSAVPAPRAAVIPAAPPVPRWEQARARFDALRAEYAGYECDPMLVLRLPALTDVTVPSTGRFIEYFAEAQALDSDHAPGQQQAAAFAAAVDRACRAWQAAKDAAERIRLSGLDPKERDTVQRVIKLLSMARDTDSDAERLTAYGRARSELARLERTGTLHLPHPAQAVLDAAARGELPVGSDRAAS